jgi:hypothetical protein
MIFRNLKDKVPLNFQKKYPAAKNYTDIYRLELLLTYLSFCGTVTLRENSQDCVKTKQKIGLTRQYIQNIQIHHQRTICTVDLA